MRAFVHVCLHAAQNTLKEASSPLSLSKTSNKHITHLAHHFSRCWTTCIVLLFVMRAPQCNWSTYVEVVTNSCATHCLCAFSVGVLMQLCKSFIISRTDLNSPVIANSWHSSVSVRGANCGTKNSARKQYCWAIYWRTESTSFWILELRKCNEVNQTLWTQCVKQNSRKMHEFPFSMLREFCQSNEVPSTSRRYVD